MNYCVVARRRVQGDCHRRVYLNNVTSPTLKRSSRRRHSRDRSSVRQKVLTNSEKPNHLIAILSSRNSCYYRFCIVFNRSIHSISRSCQNLHRSLLGCSRPLAPLQQTQRTCPHRRKRMPMMENLQMAKREPCRRSSRCACSASSRCNDFISGSERMLMRSWSITHTWPMTGYYKASPHFNTLFQGGRRHVIQMRALRMVE